MEQLDFNWSDGTALERELARLTGRRISIVVTDNTSTMMTVRREAGTGAIKVRLHRMFLSADPRVIRALGDWVKQPRDCASGAIIDDFIRRHRHLIRTRRREDRLCTRGLHHDLQSLFDQLNKRYFQGRIGSRITWGRMPPGRRRRSIRFGSYTVEDDLIRVHPLLDQEFVPRYFVRYIVYHEMLHAFLGVGRDKRSGRRCMHTPEFKRLEEAYPEYEIAVAWQNEPANLRKLLR